MDQADWERHLGPAVQPLKDILAVLECEDHVATDDEIDQAFLIDKYAGCASCWAAMIARATLEGKEYPPPAIFTVGG